MIIVKKLVLRESVQLDSLGNGRLEWNGGIKRWNGTERNGME